MSPSLTNRVLGSAHPSSRETAGRLWTRLPPIWKTLIPALAALLLVLLPANLYINSRFRDSLLNLIRARHNTVLTEAGGAIEALLRTQLTALSTLATDPSLTACAESGCTSEEAQTFFLSAIRARPFTADNELIELGLLTPDGDQKAYAARALNGQYSTGADGSFTLDPRLLEQAEGSDGYVMALARDTRISPTESYQQPALRLILPIRRDDQQLGYLSSLIGMDSFLTRTLVYSTDYDLTLLDTYDCPIAGSVIPRETLYRTWRGDPTRTCESGAAVQVWDVVTQVYDGQLTSTRVLPGALVASGQIWTLVITQPVETAFAEADQLARVLAGAHLLVAVVMVGLLLGADQAQARARALDQSRRAANARDSRFNPYNFTAPVEDPRRFVGRGQALASAIGIGVLGGNDLLVTGEPAIGKTSLLKQILQRIKQEQIPDPTNVYLGVLIDLRSVSESALYGVIISSILSELPRHHPSLELRYNGRSVAYGVMSFREDLNEIAAMQLRPGIGLRIILMFDDAENWIQSYSDSVRQTLFDVLSDIGGRVNVILSSSQLKPDQVSSQIQHLPLEPLAAIDIRRVILEPITGIYPVRPDALQLLIENSRGRPARAQKLSYFSVRLMLEQDSNAITHDHVVRAIASIGE